MTRGFPLLLDVEDRLVVIVGGGSVAARKAKGLLAAGATRIRCVAPAFCDDLPGRVERFIGEYTPQCLDGAGLAFAATDCHDVNNAVVRDARRRGVLVCRADADDAEPGDFSTPATLVDGQVLITVSTGSPALAAALRDDLRPRIHRRFVLMAEAMAILRPEIRGSRLAPAMRAQLFRDLAGAEALAIVDAGGLAALRDWLAQHYPELIHG